LDRGTIIWKEYPSLNEFRNWKRGKYL
jgi:hypothetical protein